MKESEQPTLDLIKKIVDEQEAEKIRYDLFVKYRTDANTILTIYGLPLANGGGADRNDKITPEVEMEGDNQEPKGTESGKKYSIYLMRSSTQYNRETNMSIRFRKLEDPHDLVPALFEFHDGDHKYISSCEGELKTPEQFEGLNSTLKLLRAALKLKSSTVFVSHSTQSK